ncbi:AF4/FMR2 family member 1 isoform X2 [Pseudorasbora parva]|uniref:AF4/FMR2 family member 1 isoform X2 n=1 Tax=Pseudorasbora parva TaxID=51549 RepID=UPI00351E395D
MSDRFPESLSGQCRPRAAGESSVQMEDRNVLRRIEKERRSQEVQQEPTEYDRITPLFSEPFKRIKCDALSSRIQRMLGNYEDGSDGLAAPTAPASESWDSFPALRPPVDPLSPLQSSDSSPDRRDRRTDVPPLALPLNLHCKLAKAAKPTAYVRPMDGQDQLTSDSPQLKASPEHLQDLKETTLPPLQSADVVSAVHAEDILQEMTSWPPLLTNICTPSSAEPPKLLSTDQESHGFTALKAHESSVGVQLELQGGSSTSSDSDSSSDTDSENNNTDQPAAHEPSHTQTQKGSDWQLGRWLERKESQPDPGSPRDVIKPNSHDPAGRSEATGQQGCRSNLSDHAQTEGSVEISQRAENASTCRSKPKREKAARDPEQTRTVGSRPGLLVQIQLSRLSRIPPQPKASGGRTSASKRAAERDEKSPKKKQKQKKEDKEGKQSKRSLHQSEAARSSDSAPMEKKRKSRTHGSGVPQDAGLKGRSAAAPDHLHIKAEAHGKKSCKRPVVPEEPAHNPAAEARPPDRRKRSVEDHLKEAKKLKHKADATADKTGKSLRYLEAALKFMESAIAMETQPQTPKSAYTMFSETLDLIRFILKLKNYTDPSATGHDRDFYILCLRCQSLLQMAMFRFRRESALQYSRTLADHFRVSLSPSGSLLIPQPIQQMAASYISVTTLFLNALEIWEQADDLTHSGSGLLIKLDSAIGPLSLNSSMSLLVSYVQNGLRRIRRLTQNRR